MNNLDQLRERFEAWHRSRYKGLNYAWSTSNGYLNARIDLDFEIYQAAHISAVKQCAEIAKKIS